MYTALLFDLGWVILHNTGDLEAFVACTVTDVRLSTCGRGGRTAQYTWEGGVYGSVHVGGGGCTAQYMWEGGVYGSVHVGGGGVRLSTCGRGGCTAQYTWEGGVYGSVHVGGGVYGSVHVGGGGGCRDARGD